MSRRRLRAVAAALALALAAIVVRAAQISVLEHEQWLERARRQHEQVITVPGPRGDIRTADGYVLAASLDRDAVQVDTGLLTYPMLFAQAAAPLLGVTPEELMERLTTGPRAVWLAQRAPEAVAEALRDLAPDAVVLVPDWERVYPLGTLAAATVGFVGREELRTVGRSGLEHHFDALLAGEPAQYLAVNDAIRRRLRLERVQGGRTGADVVLTLDARIQAASEAVLRRVVDEHDARAASAVVLEPSSGELLALASVPGFDPEDAGAVPPERWRLRPVQDAFEPGSTVKPLVAAAALASGVVRPGERFDCTHRGTRVAGRWIRDHAEPGLYTIDEIVIESANAGIIEVAERVEPELLWRALNGFGFGRRPGIGFPAEASGILPEPERWSGMSRAGLALGQELSASPLQVAVAYAAVANGGWKVRPRLVREDPWTGERMPETSEHVLDAPLAGRLAAMLESVVEHGTGQTAAVPGYRVAGKTGTAQRAGANGFDDDRHTAWFAGFLPLPDPRVVIVVAVENPERGFWASEVAAPAFASIAASAMNRLGVPPVGRPVTGGTT